MKYWVVIFLLWRVIMWCFLFWLYKTVPQVLIQVNDLIHCDFCNCWFLASKLLLSILFQYLVKKNILLLFEVGIELFYSYCEVSISVYVFENALEMWLRLRLILLKHCRCRCHTFFTFVEYTLCVIGFQWSSLRNNSEVIDRGVRDSDWYSLLPKLLDTLWLTVEESFPSVYL